MLRCSYIPFYLISDINLSWRLCAFAELKCMNALRKIDALLPPLLVMQVIGGSMLYCRFCLYCQPLQDQCHILPLLLLSTIGGSMPYCRHYFYCFKALMPYCPIDSIANQPVWWINALWPMPPFILLPACSGFMSYCSHWHCISSLAGLGGLLWLLVA